MSYVAILGIFLISLIGGILNEVALLSDSSTRDATIDGADTIVSTTSILTYSDTEQNRNAANTEVTAPGIADRNWWDFFLDTISWDFVYLSGDLQIVRQFMFVVTMAIFAWGVLTIGAGLLGAIKNAAPG